MVLLRPVGERALLAEVSGVAEALALASWARGARLEAVEVVPGAASVLFDGVRDPAGLGEVLRGWTPPAAEQDTGPPRPVVEIPVTYDGEDLAEVAALWGTDTAGVAARHVEVEFVSAFCGFAPGFAYLAGLPDELAVPRLASPRPRVPAGAVAVAGTWCAVYPGASPGGWRIIGRTTSTLWDASRAEPALLSPGTRVRFIRP